MEKMIRFFNTTITDKAKELVNQALDTTFISAGKQADNFESHLKSWIGDAVTVNSGTAALHLALECAGIGEGDEVILPAQTFIASGLAILHAGAKPVFADINYMTGNINPESIKDKITDKTKAIMVVHWGGNPCDMDEINQIAKDNGLVVVEDAAHALGAKYKGKQIGTISDYTCFSFQAIKLLTTGDGGAVCALNEDNIKRLKKLRWFNIDRDDDRPDLLGERVYNSDKVGFKYHMNDIAASLGIGNLSKIQDKLDRVRRIANYYRDELENVDGITLFEEQDDRISANWLFGFHVERRKDFIYKMNYNGIPSSVVHLGIDDNKIFGGKDKSLANQRKFDDTQIHIPIHDALTDNDIKKIVSTIKSGW
jgi:perosamine synthetase